TGWKDWQLHLWHAFSYQPLATYATIFRLILISSTTRKSPARSGGLKLSNDSDRWSVGRSAETLSARAFRAVGGRIVAPKARVRDLGFSDVPLDAFRHLRSDLENFLQTFISGRSLPVNHPEPHGQDEERETGNQQRKRDPSHPREMKS
ncbi:MAG TPA: hypothetical protein VKL19_12780, partial [Thermoanaerobaculia bacterium]|nr:hypothetical protein [Thermoanaerobaculia bacterium]